MIRRLDQIEPLVRDKFLGGKGAMEARPLLQDKEFFGKGRVFGCNTLKPGCSVGIHTHKGDFEVYYILKGEGVYNDNGKNVPIKAGDVTYTWDGESHGLENTGKEDLVFIALILFTQ